MARTALSVVQGSRAGTAVIAAVAGDVANGNVVPNDGKTGLLIKNTGSTVARTVSFSLFRTVDGQAVVPRAEAVPIGETQLFGPFPTEDYGSQLALNVDHAELTIQAVRI